uniref:Uncharacterized protein n=1 Tax=Gopherus agassizii TaxID=38772 RepID=A0A452GSG3_9SAUR
MQGLRPEHLDLKLLLSHWLGTTSCLVAPPCRSWMGDRCQQGVPHAG